MCASVSSLLLFTLTTISILFGTRMATEGLPLVRQERGAEDRGLLTGADFLSVFISSSLRQAYRETTTSTTPEPTTLIPTTWQPDVDNSYTRATRSTSLLTSSPIAQSNTEQTSFYDTTISAQLQKQSSDSSANDGVVVAVSVSSSVGRTLINKETTDQHIKDTTIRETATETTEIVDQNFVASEEHASIVAEANKSEFSVEESEPITTNSELTGDFVRGYPASIQPLPRHQNSPFNPTSDFINQQLGQNSDKDKLQPIHQTVIYHNNPREPGRARSVSYSTVVQAVPHPDVEKQWESEKLERHERHFDDSQTSFNNNFHNEGDKIKFNGTQSAAETSHTKTDLNLEKSDADSHIPDSSTRRNSFTTEKNWEIQEKPYTRALPTVYGKPEQNYEVDESASVMTNGRVHGIQPNPTLPSKQEVKIGESRKVDDNQKVGYVVEGRNYRKYRVEERTSDGFIVGEYGVVSHDDGSLRGVRYTADGTISPRLIYDALMKFLSL